MKNMYHKLHIDEVKTVSLIFIIVIMGWNNFYILRHVIEYLSKILELLNEFFWNKNHSWNNEGIILII